MNSPDTDLAHESSIEQSTFGDRFRVLVCGGRGFSDRERVFRFLDELNAEWRFTGVIHGNSAGADSLAGEWARKNRVCEFRFNARWELHGRAAGPIRNRRMLTEGMPSLVVAFPGSRGTDDMIGLALKSGIRVLYG